MSISWYGLRPNRDRKGKATALPMKCPLMFTWFEVLCRHTTLDWLYSTDRLYVWSWVHSLFRSEARLPFESNEISKSDKTSTDLSRLRPILGHRFSPLVESEEPTHVTCSDWGLLVHQTKNTYQHLPRKIISSHCSNNHFIGNNLRAKYNPTGVMPGAHIFITHVHIYLFIYLLGFWWFGRRLVSAFKAAFGSKLKLHIIFPETDLVTATRETRNHSLPRSYVFSPWCAQTGYWKV